MKYKSDILGTIHENATANFEIGAISAEKMREYDEMCLEPEADYSVDTIQQYSTKHLPTTNRRKTFHSKAT